MPILQPKDRQAVQQRFDLELKRDVNLTLFTQPHLGGLYIPGRECPSCHSTEQLVEEVGDLSPKLHVEVVDFYANHDDVEARGVSMIPAVIVSADATNNVKFYGLPSGFEFAVLMDTIIAAAGKKSSLQLETRRQLRRLQEDVHIQVFVTPT